MNKILYGTAYHTIVDFPAVINLPYPSRLYKLYNQIVAAPVQLFASSIDLLLTKDRKRYRHIRNFRNKAKNELLGDKDYILKWMEELVKE